MIVHNTIQLKTKRNHQIIAFEGDSITNEIIQKGEYDSNTLSFISDILTLIKPNVCLDIGANIGNHSLVIASKCERLISFEPIPFLHDVLSKNFQINNFQHVTALNLGLSDVSKDTNIFVDRNGNLGSSSITERHGNGELSPIVLKKGDDFLKHEGILSGIDFIKIDVEGHEAEALIGLSHSIQNNQPLIILEWKTDKTLQTFDDFDLFRKLFNEYSYYSITKTHSKKIYAKNLKGFLHRVFCRLFNKTWCLSKFDSKRHYANVCFVPPRYQALFSELKYVHHETT